MYGNQVKMAARLAVGVRRDAVFLATSCVRRATGKRPHSR